MIVMTPGNTPLEPNPDTDRPRMNTELCGANPVIRDPAIKIASVSVKTCLTLNIWNTFPHDGRSTVDERKYAAPYQPPSERACKSFVIVGLILDMDNELLHCSSDYSAIKCDKEKWEGKGEDDQRKCKGRGVRLNFRFCYRFL